MTGYQNLYSESSKGHKVNLLIKLSMVIKKNKLSLMNFTDEFAEYLIKFAYHANVCLFFLTSIFYFSLVEKLYFIFSELIYVIDSNSKVELNTELFC